MGFTLRGNFNDLRLAHGFRRNARQASLDAEHSCGAGNVRLWCSQGTGTEESSVAGETS